MLCPAKLPKFTSAQLCLSQLFPCSTNFFDFSPIPVAWKRLPPPRNSLFTWSHASKLEDFNSWLKKNKNPRRKPIRLVRYVAHKCPSEVNTPAKSRHYAKIISNKSQEGPVRSEQQRKEHMAAVGRLMLVSIAFN